MIHCLFIAHISAPTPNGPSLSYMMFPSSYNILLCKVGSFILIHVCFCHVFSHATKKKKMAMFNHIVLQEKKCIVYETCWI
jgi:hypothetical protein